MTPKIVTVASSKGGVGKTTLAYEVAVALDAPLVDLDWDEGGATRKWGYRHRDRVKAPLLEALDSGRTPKPLAGRARKPDLVPGHPHFEQAQPDPETMAGLLEKWAADWGRPFIVVDTHPGAAHGGHGAMLAAHVVVVPVILATHELNALEGMLVESGDYPLLLTPNRVPRRRLPAEVDRLRDLVDKYGPAVAPLVPEVRELPYRKTQQAVVGQDPVPAAYRPFADAVHAVAAAVRSYVDE
ncbi:ParA family protein [Kineococcus rhizosphaerae]|uniref:Chromosome partitioning protein n=1 Tax=Kineococcus rhizosphaerae TaxID=559628 RepID=A0A2T0QTJ6_9ACTN|nr:ParA family protein [Kineococcus rhizosphaerae]PRY08420.1 chromosome partitioning protein [Kineococcus rhizosphaerae]